MLGRPYSIAGQVVPGDRLGRKLGFPTANLNTTGLALPPRGVYAVVVRLKGQSHHGVLNIGIRPTLGEKEPQLRVETHVLDFSGDLYHDEIEVVFAQKLRDETRFPSLDLLQAQIQRDIAEARHRLDAFEMGGRST